MSRRLAALTTAALIAGTPSTADARDDCRTKRCIERVAKRECSQRNVVPCIRRAALHYRQPFHDALRVARCESGLNPFASNGEHAGLYQFRVAHPSTWATTKYAARDPYRAKWSALAAMWAWSVGRRGEWACR
jgi:hypothetical protein